ncbi:MAG: exosortase/archaeosortase family protein [Kosmotogaceae bacterium]|nr:exosortase/archaeosortase family protein [Kosmotogaceae bacterium]
MSKKKDRVYWRKVEILADFIIKFNLLAIPMYLFIYSGASLIPLQTLVADVSSRFISLAGYDVSRQGHFITATRIDPIKLTIDSHIIDINVDCTGWKTMYAFAALLIASPIKNDRKKVRDIANGALLLAIINVFRIVTTIMIALEIGFHTLDFVHTFLWREGLVIVLIVLWYAWFRKQKNNISQGQTMIKSVYKALSGLR